MGTMRPPDSGKTSFPNGEGTETGRRWNIVGASVRGTSHQKGGTERQDAFAWELCDREGREPVLLLGVSDGAGSTKYGRQGAEIACRVLVSEMRTLVRGRGVDEITEADAEGVIHAIREEIRFSAEAKGKEIRQKVEPEDFACTLIGAVIGERAACFFQIGDGGIVIGSEEEDGYLLVFWPKQGQYANETEFVTGADSELMFRTVSGSVNEAALFTDGIQRLVIHMREKRPHGPFFRNMFRHIRKKGSGEGYSKPLSKGLARYLDSKVINRRTDDDKTLVLAERKGR